LGDVSTLAAWFLRIAGVVMLIVFALPLLVSPMRWARAFGWKLPEDTDLAVYLGRCIGGLAVGVIVVAVHASFAPREHRIVFELLFVGSALLTLVHVKGALEGRQPRAETYEIVLYGALTVASGAFYWMLG
jgi:hypothetical protein